MDKQNEGATAAGAPKIEIRNLKFSALATRETLCFQAAVYIDGKRVGAAHNDGHGGATHIEPRECRERLDAHFAHHEHPFRAIVSARSGPS